MIKPPELDSGEGDIVWSALTASEAGDVDALRRLLERDPRLSRAEYWYTQRAIEVMPRSRASSKRRAIAAAASRSMQRRSIEPWLAASMKTPRWRRLTFARVHDVTRPHAPAHSSDAKAEVVRECRLRVSA
jgi:hypothetical protein